MKLSDYEYYRTENGVLYCGDCLDILPLIKDKVDLILTDPPYNIHITGGGIITREKKKYLDNIEKNFGSDFNPTKYLKLSLNIMDKYNAYWWCSRLILNDYINFAKKNKFNFDLLVWNKSNPMPLKNNKYLPDTEQCIFIRNNNPYFNNNLPFDYYRKIYNEPIQLNNGHPTPKPENIIIKQIKISTKENDLILDPFIGSGTTAVACEKLGRRWIGIEISEKYCEIAKQRIKAEYDKLKLEFKED